MKLYMWCNPYPVAYGSSMVFAVAESLEEAKVQAGFKATGWSYGDCPQRDVTWSNIKLGQPTRIVELPCAEWHEWSE